ncbi:twinfilin [Brachionus plicatilis]|uniref:Twinfilin n=1 Tax=Brachionus plicatilis TaxID=10195 RepID=A0A3M7QEP6_BRAPC|nr:twinfilin [Brachionus plicatilis]
MSHQSGIKSNEKLRNFFAHAKQDKTRMFKVVINDKEELELSNHHEVQNSNWQTDFNKFVLESIEPKSPCYIFYRLDEKTNSGYTWLLILWSPDFATVKQKMLYASTKSTLKMEFGSGQVADEMFATIMDEISLEGYLKHVKSQEAPAPLTNREEEIEFLKQNEDHTRINVDTKHKTLQGVMFPIDNSAVQALEAFKKENSNYVQLIVNIEEEQIQSKRLYTLNDVSKVEDIKKCIPEDKGRFHLFRFSHTHDGQRFKSVIFIYSMPGFSVSIKERMIYSSTKSEMIQYIKSHYDIEINKAIEISEPSELNESFFIEELHPKKVADSKKFDKPKGPNSRGAKRLTRPDLSN